MPILTDLFQNEEMGIELQQLHYLFRKFCLTSAPHFNIKHSAAEFIELYDSSVVWKDNFDFNFPDDELKIISFGTIVKNHKRKFLYSKIITFEYNVKSGKKQINIPLEWFYDRRFQYKIKTKAMKNDSK